MAHFVKIEDGIVTQVITVSNCSIGSCIGPVHWDYQEEYHEDHDKGIDFPESELLGQEVLAESGFDGTWLQTSYNNKFRGKFAGVGMIYNQVTDEFIVPNTEEEVTE